MWLFIQVLDTWFWCWSSRRLWTASVIDIYVSRSFSLVSFHLYCFILFLQTRVREVIATYDVTIINTGDEVLYLGQYYANRSSTPVPVPDPDHPRDVTAGSGWGPRTSGSVRLGETSTIFDARHQWWEARVKMFECWKNIDNIKSM